MTDATPRKPRTSRSRKASGDAPGDAATVKPTRTRKTSMANKSVSIDFSKPELRPIQIRLVEIALACDIPSPDFSDPETVTTLLNKLATLTEGEKIVYTCEPQPVPAFLKARKKAESDEKESPFEFIASFLGQPNEKVIMVTDKELIDKAVQVGKWASDRYDLNRFIKDAIRKAAQTEISTWAAREVLVDGSKNKVRLRTGTATEDTIRKTIDDLRACRSTEASWNTKTGGNVPIITYSLVAKYSSSGINTVTKFLEAVRATDEEDKYEDVYPTYRDYRESGNNPEHRVGYKGA
jgi:hypothetical protein